MISRSDVLNRIVDVSVLEKIIDSLLTVEIGDRGREYTSLDTRNMSAPQIKRILALYRAGGWRVEHVHDQRDGDFLQFWAAGENK